MIHLVPSGGGCAVPLPLRPAPPADTGVGPECWLADRLFEAPALLLAGDASPAHGRFRPVCRELPLPGSGYADLFGITPEGEVALVEVKLGRNAEAKREILAQAIDYWRALRRVSFEELEAACSRGQRTRLLEGQGLYEVSGAAAEGRIGADEFRARVTERLRSGRVLLLLVLDRALDTLVRLVTEAVMDQPTLPFDIGLVEVGIHDAPGSGIVLAPRLCGAVLTRTRAVVRFEGALAVELAADTAGRDGGLGSSTQSPARTLGGLLAELDGTARGLGARFAAFLAKVSELGVRAEVARSAVLRLGEVNIGSVGADAGLQIYFTEPSRETGPEAFEAYLREVASLAGGAVSIARTGEPRLRASLIAALEDEAGWFAAIREYREATEALARPFRLPASSDSGS